MNKAAPEARPDPNLNGEWLAGLFAAEGVRKPRASWHLDRAAFAHLAADVAVRAFRHRHPEKPGLPAMHDDIGGAAAQALREALLARRADAEAALEQAHAFLADRRQQGFKPTARDAEQPARWSALIAKIDKAVADVDAMTPLLKIARSPEVRAGWHDHAVDLARNFRRRYAECNRGDLPGISEGGPVAAYVAAVVPIITREKRPSISAVAFYLKERRSQIEG